MNLQIVLNTPKIPYLNQAAKKNAPRLASRGINFDWLNGWKCWSLASKIVCMEESKIRLEKWKALEMLSIAKLIKIRYSCIRFRI